MNEVPSKYPQQYDVFEIKRDAEFADDPNGDYVLAEDVNDLQDSVISIQNVLGTNPNGQSITVNDRIRKMESLSLLRVPPILFYLGDRASINGATSIDDAILHYLKYDYIVFGKALGANDATIISRIKSNRDVKIYGYIDCGISTSNLTTSELQVAIQSWADIGVDGIYCSNFGFDQNVSRERQNTILDTIHEKGLVAFIDSTNPDHVFSDTYHETLNPEWVAPHIESGDIYHYKSFSVDTLSTPQYISLDTVLNNMTRLYAYRKDLGIKVFGTATINPEDPSAQAFYNYAHGVALLTSLDAFYSVSTDMGELSNTARSYQWTPVVGQWYVNSPKITQISTDLYKRETGFGSISIDTLDHKVVLEGISIPYSLLHIKDGEMNGSLLADASISDSKIISYNSERLIDAINADASSKKISLTKIATISGSDISGDIPKELMSAQVIQAINAYVGTAQIGSAKIEDLDASKITTGTLEAGRISASVVAALNLYAAEIEAGSVLVDSAVVGNLSAEHIQGVVVEAINLKATTAVIDVAKIPDLSATKITADDIASDRMRANVVSAINAYAENLTAESARINSLVVDNLTANHIKSVVVEAINLKATNTTIDAARIGTLTANNIGANTINSNHIHTDGLNASVIKTGYISADRIQFGSISGDHIASSSITTGHISVDGIDGGVIKADSIHGSKIIAGTLSASNLQAGSITSVEIAAQTIQTRNLASGAVDASILRAGTITAEHISTVGLDANLIEIFGNDGQTLIGDGYLRVDGLDVGVVQSDNLIGNGLFLTGSSSFGWLRDNPEGEAVLGNQSKIPGSHQVWRIDLATGSKIEIDTGGSKPVAIDIDDAYQYGYVTLQGDDKIIQIYLDGGNAASRTGVELTTGKGPGKILYTGRELEDHKHFFVLNTDPKDVNIPDTIMVLDAPPNSINSDTYVHHMIPVGNTPYDIIMKHDHGDHHGESGMYTYITLADQGDVAILDTTSPRSMDWKVKRTIPIGAHGTDNYHGGLDGRFGLNQVVGGDASTQYSDKMTGNEMSGHSDSGGYGTSDGSMRKYTPHGIAASADSEHIYVTDYENGHLLVIDIHGNAPYNYMTGTRMAANYGGNTEPTDPVAASISSEDIFSTQSSGHGNSGPNDSEPISTPGFDGLIPQEEQTTQWVRYRIPIGNSPESIKVVGGKIFVTLEGSNQVAVMNEQDILDEIEADRLYYATWDLFQEMRALPHWHIHKLHIGSKPVEMTTDPSSTYLYVTVNGQNQIAQIDINAVNTAMLIDPHAANLLPESVIAQRFNTGPNPKGVVISPDGKHLYVVNHGGSGNLSFVYPKGNYIGDAYLGLEGGVEYHGAEHWVPDRSEWIYELSDGSTTTSPHLGGNVRSAATVEFRINEPFLNEGGYTRLSLHGRDEQWAIIEQDVFNVVNYSNGNNIAFATKEKLKQDASLLRFWPKNEWLEEYGVRNVTLFAKSDGLLTRDSGDSRIFYPAKNWIDKPERPVILVGYTGDYQEVSENDYTITYGQGAKITFNEAIPTDQEVYCTSYYYSEMPDSSLYTVYYEGETETSTSGTNYSDSHIKFVDGYLPDQCSIEVDYTFRHNRWFKSHNGSTLIATENSSSQNFHVQLEIDEFVPKFITYDNQQTEGFQYYPIEVPEATNADYTGLEYSFDAFSSRVVGRPESSITASGPITPHANPALGGVAEEVSLDLSGTITTEGSITISLGGTLNHVSRDIPAYVGDTAIVLADRIRNTEFSGWTVSGAIGSPNVLFTANDAEAKPDSTFSTGTSAGVTGTLTTTTQGVDGSSHSVTAVTQEWEFRDANGNPNQSPTNDSSRYVVIDHPGTKWLQIELDRTWMISHMDGFFDWHSTWDLGDYYYTRVLFDHPDNENLGVVEETTNLAYKTYLNVKVQMSDDGVHWNTWNETPEYNASWFGFHQLHGHKDWNGNTSGLNAKPGRYVRVCADGWKVVHPGTGEILATGDTLEVQTIRVYADWEYEREFSKNYAEEMLNKDPRTPEIHFIKGTVTSSGGEGLFNIGEDDEHDLKRVVNANLEPRNYYTPGQGAASVTVDLGEVQQVDTVRVYRYYQDGRIHHGAKTEISSDGVIWTTIYDSAINGEYAEIPAGQIISLGSLTSVRYIRDSATSWSTTLNDGSTITGSDIRWINIHAYIAYNPDYPYVYQEGSELEGQNLATNGQGIVTTSLPGSFIALDIKIDFTSWWYMTYLVSPEFGQINIEMPTLMGGSHSLFQDAPYINKVAHRHIMSWPESSNVKADASANVTAGKHRVMIRHISGKVSIDRLRFEDFQYYYMNSVEIPKGNATNFIRYKIEPTVAKWYIGRGNQSTEGAYDNPRTNPDTGKPDQSVPIKYRFRVRTRLLPKTLREERGVAYVTSAIFETGRLSSHWRMSQAQDSFPGNRIQMWDPNQPHKTGIQHDHLANGAVRGSKLMSLSVMDHHISPYARIMESKLQLNHPTHRHGYHITNPDGTMTWVSNKDTLDSITGWGTSGVSTDIARADHDHPEHIRVNASGIITDSLTFGANVLLQEGVTIDGVDVSVLSSNFTTHINNADVHFSATERTKLSGISAGATKTEASLTNGNIKINGSEVSVYSHPANHSLSMITETEALKIMTSAERTKLTGIEDGANNYVHPSSHSIDMIIETTDLKVMTATERTKLSGIDDNANNYSHPTGDGNNHVPADSGMNTNKVLKATATAGSPVWGSVAWSELTGVPTSFTPSTHSHGIADITNLSTTLSAKAAKASDNTFTGTNTFSKVGTSILIQPATDPGVTPVDLFQLRKFDGSSTLISMDSSGNMHVKGNLIVDGTQTTTSSTTSEGDFTVNGNLSTIGATTLGDGSDQTTVRGNLVVEGNTTLGDAATDTTTVKGDLRLEGDLIAAGKYIEVGRFPVYGIAGDPQYQSDAVDLFEDIVEHISTFDSGGMSAFPATATGASRYYKLMISYSNTGLDDSTIRILQDDLVTEIMSEALPSVNGTVLNKARTWMSTTFSTNHIGDTVFQAKKNLSGALAIRYIEVIAYDYFS